MHTSTPGTSSPFLQPKMSINQQMAYEVIWRSHSFVCTQAASLLWEPNLSSSTVIKINNYLVQQEKDTRDLCLLAVHITGYGWRLEQKQIEKGKRDHDKRPWKFCFSLDEPRPTGISLGNVCNVGPLQGIEVGGGHVPGTGDACLDSHKRSAEISVHTRQHSGLFDLSLEKKVRKVIGSLNGHPK